MNTKYGYNYIERNRNHADKAAVKSAMKFLVAILAYALFTHFYNLI